MGHHSHFNPLTHLLKNKLREVYLNITIYAFAMTLVSIFVPIYLLQLGYSLDEALWYILIEWGVFALFSPVSAWLSSKFGFKHILLFRLPLNIGALLLLSFFDRVNIPIYLVAILFGISGSLYAIPLTSLFTKYSDKKHRGVETGKLITFPHLAAILSPILGAWIASYFGFSILFIIASLLLVFSVVPLFFSKDMKPHVTFSLRKIEHFLKEDLTLVLGFMASAIRHMTLAVILPLFTYYLVDDLRTVGFVFTLLLLGTGLINLFLGRFADKYGVKILLRAGGLGSFVAFLFFMFVGSGFDLMLIAFFGGIAFAMLQIPFEKRVYDDAAKHNAAEFLVYKELMLGFFRVVYLLLLIFVVDKFFVAFGVASLTSLIYLLF